MSLHWLEVAPAAPALVEALPPLLMLAGLLFALGCVVLIDAFVKALFGVISKIVSGIPLIGGLTSDLIHSAEHAISGALGSGVSGIERSIAHQFHNLARVAQHLWHTLEDMAHVTATIARWLAGAASLGDVQHAIRTFRHALDVAEHDAAAALRHSISTEKAALQSVAHWIYPRIRSIEHEVGRVIPREIKSARSLAREAERGVARLWDRVRGLEQAVSAGAIAAAIAAALAAVGLDWLACRDGATRAGRSGCNLWDDLGNLLGIAIIPLEIASLYELIAVAQTVTEEVVSVAEDVLKV